MKIKRESFKFVSNKYNFQRFDSFDKCGDLDFYLVEKGQGIEDGFTLEVEMEETGNITGNSYPITEKYVASEYDDFCLKLEKVDETTPTTK